MLYSSRHILTIYAARFTMMRVVAKFVKFSGVGAIGTAAHYATLIFVIQMFHANAVLASSTGAVVGALVNYFLNYSFTFRSSKRHHEALTKFLVIASVGFLLNGTMMALLTETASMHYLPAQLITTATVLMWTFTGNHRWTFREKHSE
jgi:putative flippase GtrA